MFLIVLYYESVSTLMHDINNNKAPVITQIYFSKRLIFILTVPTIVYVWKVLLC